MFVWHVDLIQVVTLVVIMLVGIVYIGIGFHQDWKRRKKDRRR